MVIFSAAQPSHASLHLGNYLGAVRRWVELQQTGQCLFCIVDLHALTSFRPQDGESLRSRSENLLANYIACGVDPAKATLFLQSDIPEHTELCWILGCLTSVGWLNRMTQFKDKTSEKSASMGLYCYPVLMAADILLYHADTVPVGNDQKQHVELAQAIAKAFNAAYNVEYFRMPVVHPFDTTSRVMSLRNAQKKMSKSDPSDFSRINLDDSDDLIVKKIRKATTDSIIGFNFEELSGRPELNNLVNIFASISALAPQAVCKQFETSTINEFKTALSDLLIKEITPIRSRIKELSSEKSYISRILSGGRSAAREIASANMKEIRKIIGLT